MIAGVFAPDDGAIAFAGERIDGLHARRGLPPRHRPHLPDRAAVPGADRRGQRRRRRAAAPRTMSPWRAGAPTRCSRQLDLFDKRDQPASALTLPDRKRLEVARALATEPKLLLLDEVMAGLRPTETDRMVAILTKLNRETGLTILLIEHVMRAVMALAGARARAAPRRGDRRRHARRGRARSRGGPVLSRRGGGRLMLAVENLDLFYGDAQALDGVSLEIAEGAIVAIVGANGAGKTSLIRTIAGMHRPARGRILFRGADIAGWPSHRVCNLGIGQVAEGRQVFPTLTVAENLEMGAMLPRARAAPREESRARVRDVPAPGRARDARRPARCRAASSRCWRSAAA